MALFATLHLLLFYGLPGGILLGLLIGLGIFYFRAGAMAAISTTLAECGHPALCSRHPFNPPQSNQ